MKMREQPISVVKESEQRTKPKRETVEEPDMVSSREAPQRTNQRRNVPDRRENRQNSENETSETWTTYHTVPIVESRVKQSAAADKSRELSSSALHVQQMYEQGEFDQEISVSRGEYTRCIDAVELDRIYSMQ